MFTAKTLQVDQVTDRDMFNYITERMLDQGVKSQEQWYDSESDTVEDGDSCQYFGYDIRTETSLRCAVGWIMNKEIFKEYQDQQCSEIEGSGIQTVEPLEVVILSNENWNFTKESWVMLSIMQRIHDNMEVHDWECIFENMSYLFNSDGKFCPNHIVKDEQGNDFDQRRLYLQQEYDTRTETRIDVEAKVHFVDFEELGISFKIQHHNSTMVNNIADAIQSGDISCFDPKVTGLNILEAENQETADVSAMNFLDIVDAVRENQKREEMIPIAGE